MSSVTAHAASRKAAKANPATPTCFQNSVGGESKTWGTCCWKGEEAVKANPGSRDDFSFFDQRVIQQSHSIALIEKPTTLPTNPSRYHEGLLEVWQGTCRMVFHPSRNTFVPVGPGPLRQRLHELATTGRLIQDMRLGNMARKDRMGRHGKRGGRYRKLSR
eukprot:scaffold3079_cov174-Amphora_coffeaeformis.AAC.4